MTDDTILLVLLLCILNILTSLRVISLLERILYMKMPFFASFIVFLILISYEISKSRRQTAKMENSFWEKEYYITIPFDTLPMDTLAEDETVSECHQVLRNLADSPIVNFTGISNTDLKLQYGAPNIDLLMRYDQNYTTLACTLQKWAEKLYHAGYVREARRILEFAVSSGTDVSGCYRLLSSIYAAEGNMEEIGRLKEQAENLKSGTKNIIVRILQEFDP